MNADDRNIFLSTLPATHRERAAALAVVGISTILFACAVPFAGTPLTPVPAFVASYQSALAIIDLITAILLFSQFSILRSRALLLLASGYLFTSVAAVAHALTFPGLFTPTGLFNSGLQTTAWLYMVWHGGFPILVLGYALLKDRDGGPMITRIGRLGDPGECSGRRCCDIGRGLDRDQPASPSADATKRGRYTPTMDSVVSTVWLLSLAALLVLLFRRPYSVIDVWLMVVMCAWLFDIAISAVFNVAQVRSGLLCRPDLRALRGKFRPGGTAGRQCRPAGPDHPFVRHLAPAAPLPTGIVTANASACSARWSNHPTMPSSQKRSTASSRAGIGQPSACLDSAPQRRSVIASTSSLRRRGAPRCNEILGRVARGEAVEHYETVRRHKNGREVQVSLGVSPIRSAGERSSEPPRPRATSARAGGRSRRSTRRSRSGGAYSRHRRISFWSRTPLAVLSRSARAP